MRSVCLGNIYQYPPSCCIWRKPKLSLQRLWMLRMLRMLHWLHRLQLHRWLMNGWCMLQWLWHWLHWLGHWLRHWLRHRLPSMNLSRCCLIAKGRLDTHQTWQFGWPCLVRCKNSKWIQDLGGRYQNKQHGVEINAIKYSQSIQEWFHCTITASSWRSEAHWSSLKPNIIRYKLQMSYFYQRNLPKDHKIKGRTKPKVSAAPQPAGGGLEKIEMQWMIQLW